MIFLNYEDYSLFHESFYNASPFYIQLEREISNNTSNLKEIESSNNNFMQEKDIKYSLYPLYINWKKIESKSSDNNYYNVFKLFGYFGEAIFILLSEIKDDEHYYNHRNFLLKLNFYYTKNYEISQIKEDEFYKKLIKIYDDVISLIKNKIIIFKEISVFLIVMRLYENYFIEIKDNNKVLEVLKYQYKIISYIKDEEYKLIYKKYLRKIDDIEEIWLSYNKYIFPKTKQIYINHLRKVYKKINTEPIKKEKS